MGACKNHWRSEHNACSIHKGHGKLADIRLFEVELFSTNSTIRTSFHEVLHHQSRAVVHGDIGDHDEVLRWIQDPVAICIDDQFRLFVDWSVTGSNYLGSELQYLA